MEITEKEKTVKSLRTLGSVCSVLFKIFSILCLIAAVICFGAIIAAPFVPWSDAVDFITKNVTGDISFTKYLNVKYAEVACVTGLCSLVVAMVSTHLCDLLFFNIKKEGTPFRKSNVALLNKIGIVALVQAVGLPIVYAIITNATGTQDVFTSSFSGVALVFGLLIFALSLVFKYGVTLQDEADTTL